TAWMMANPNLRILCQPVSEAIKQAGKAIVENGKLSDELYEQITKPIFTRGQIFAVYNRN
ncbi:MAG: hypothetical protein ACTSQB_04830, partial [Candidatus Heimdallarchaeota archaeon]